MGGGPNPHGKIVGSMKCLQKTHPQNGHITVSFIALHPLVGSCVLTLLKEDAAYFVVGQVYEASFTTP